MTNEQLIEKAAFVINSRKGKDYNIGDVGCALITDKGNLYLGVCIDVISGMGFCAEHTAVATMITAGESKIEKIVATWKDESGNVHVLSPCGRCREFISRVNNENLATTEVVLGKEQSVTLSELLPHWNEFNKI